MGSRGIESVEELSAVLAEAGFDYDAATVERYAKDPWKEPYEDVRGFCLALDATLGHSEAERGRLAYAYFFGNRVNLAPPRD